MKKYFAISIVLGMCLLFLGAVIPEKPISTPFVYDLAEFLSESDKEELLALCKELYKKNGIHCVVYTVPTLDMQPTDFVQEMMEKWDIGGKKETGVFLLVVKQTKTSLIAVGGGLQTVLTKEWVADLVQNKLQPAISDGNFAEGIVKTTKSAVKVLEKADTKDIMNDSSKNYIYLLFIILTLLVFFRTRIRSRKMRKESEQYKETSMYRPFTSSDAKKLYEDDMDTYGFGGPGRYGDFDD